MHEPTFNLTFIYDEEEEHVGITFIPKVIQTCHFFQFLLMVTVFISNVHLR